MNDSAIETPIPVSELTTAVNSVSVENLPKLGRSFAWLALFLVLFFLAVVFYVIGFSAVIGAQFAAQGVAVPEQAQIESMIQAHLIHPNGMVGLYVLQCILLLPIILAAAHFTRQSWRETLGFHLLRFSSLVLWVGVWLVYVAASFVVNFIAELDPGDFMRSLNGSRHLAAALVLVVCAPLLEELIFRGYLFKAWRHSRLGLSGTLLLTSILFTALHLGQYNWTFLAMIFSLSMILGLAREKTGSIWAPIIIHSANNLIAVVTVIYLGLL